MRITIHRGSHQIGGMVTELATKHAKVFIDLGENLPGIETPLSPIEGLTCGDGTHSALFITHYHHDHIGALGAVLPGVPVYMGETAREIQLIKTRRLATVLPAERNLLPKIEAVKTFRAPEKLNIGDIVITPLFVDHSAFDAYMFVIEADGVRVLHTGDFRTHGVRSKSLARVLDLYAKDIDYLVCEGTMLSRQGEQPLSEHDIGLEAQKLFRGRKNIFILCSSTHIDRLAVFYHASLRVNTQRMIAVDSYQKDILNAVQERHAQLSSFYRFDKAWPWYPKYSEKLKAEGVLAFIRASDRNSSYKNWSEQVLDAYFDPSNSLLVYSFWEGYLREGIHQNASFCRLMERYHPNVILHTSGHASAKALAALYYAVLPKRGLIPLHSDAPERFAELIPQATILPLTDGETYTLDR